MDNQALKNHIALLAHYNQQMNRSIFTVLSKLDAPEISKDRGAFFGSIIGTLNHILVGDIIWLKRFTMHPANFSSLKPVKELTLPASLSDIIHPDIAPLDVARKTMDTVLISFTEEAREADYNMPLAYANTKGKTFKKNFAGLVLHLFNHQTHHRGQVSTLLNQQGIDIGNTDLLTLIPEI